MKAIKGINLSELVVKAKGNACKVMEGQITKVVQGMIIDTENARLKVVRAEKALKEAQDSLQNKIDQTDNVLSGDWSALDIGELKESK